MAIPGQQGIQLLHNRIAFGQQEKRGTLFRALCDLVIIWEDHDIVRMRCRTYRFDLLRPDIASHAVDDDHQFLKADLHFNGKRMDAPDRLQALVRGIRNDHQKVHTLDEAAR